jgi:hypothetical protein
MRASLLATANAWMAAADDVRKYQAAAPPPLIVAALREYMALEYAKLDQPRQMT